jgi:hypothetical protein
MTAFSVNVRLARREDFPMRIYSVGLVAVVLLTGCGGKYKPGGPVITGWERTQAFSGYNISTAAESGAYTGQAVVAAPVLPFMAFGAAYDLDIVLVSKHPNWDMHEFVRMSTAQGPLWVALESRAGTLDQYITADLPDIDAWMPEIPMERKATPFTIQDRSTDEQIDVEITYENVDNQIVNVVFQGDPPYREQRKRNGHAMGHARNQAIAVVDIPHRESAFKAKISFDDKNEKIIKIGGIVPFQLAMEQAQGGLAIASFYTRLGEHIPFESTLTPAVVHAPELAAIPEPDADPEPAADPLAVFIGDNREALQACYTAAAEANVELAGQVVLSWIVTEAAGAEFNAVLDTVADEGLFTCMTDALGSWEYPEGVDGEVGFPFKFVAGDGLFLPGDAQEEEGGDDEAEGGDEDLPEGGDDAEEGADDDLPEGGDDGEEADGDEDGEDGDLLGDDEDLEDIDEVVEVKKGPQLADFSTFHRMASGAEVEQKWDVSHQGNRVFVTQRSDFRTLRYEYLVYHDSLELTSVSVEQYGRATPTMVMSISPALPDLRKPFNGRHSSRYVMDINGQRGYAIGTIEAWWTESGPKVKVVPEAPSWTEDRTMVTTIQYIDGNAEIKIERIGG